MSEEKRAPLYSDEELDHLAGQSFQASTVVAVGKIVRDFYEAKIDSGGLMVVKTVKRAEAKEHVLNCKENMDDAMDTYFYTYIHFCPGCGSKIVEP